MKAMMLIFMPSVANISNCILNSVTPVKPQIAQSELLSEGG